MSHYKTNLRDIEFNLFEVLGRDEVLGTGPFGEVDGETAREILAEVDRLSREDLAASYEDSDRNPPVFDPGHAHRTGARVVQEELPGLDGLRVLAPPGLRGARRHPRPVVPDLGDRRDGARRQRARVDVRRRPGVRRRRPPQRQRARQARSPSTWSTASGAAPWCSPSPTPAPTSAPAAPRPPPNDDGSWNIEGVKRFITSAEHDMSENIIHLVLARPVGVEGVGGPGTKGLSLFIVPKFHFDPETGELTGERNGVYVTNVEHKMGIKVSNTCEVTFGDPHRRRRAGQGLAARRGARRHRADVPGHRERPDDGRHQGHRHAVDRLPQRARLRQGARPGRRPDPGRRQDRAARHDHPPPRRTPLADDAEVVRRGDARAGALHRVLAGPGHDRRARRPTTPTRLAERGQRPAAADRQGLRLRALVGAARHRVAADLRRLRLPAGVPDRAVRPRRQDRHPLRGHHRDPGPGLLLPQDRQGPGPGAGPPGRARSRRSSTARPATAGSRSSASCSPPRSRTPTRSSAT